MRADEKSFPGSETGAAELWSDVYARLAIAEEEIRAGRTRDAHTALRELRERYEKEPPR